MKRVFLGILLLTANICGQEIVQFQKIPTLVMESRSGDTHVQGTTVLDSSLFTVLHRPVIVDSLTFTTNLSNYADVEQIADSNRFFTTSNGWIIVGDGDTTNSPSDSSMVLYDSAGASFELPINLTEDQGYELVVDLEDVDTTQYYSFDGDNDYIEIAQNASIDLTDDCSFRSKFSIGEGDLNKRVYDRYYARYGLRVNSVEGINFYYTSDSGVQTVTTDVSTVVVGTEYDVIVTLDLADSVKIYIDGVFVKGASYVGTTLEGDPAQGLFLGTYFNGTDDFNGTISNFSIFDKALTPTEVTTLCNGGTVSGAVLDLNGTSENVTDNIWYDVSGNDNDGTVTGATIVNEFNSPSILTATYGNQTLFTSDTITSTTQSISQRFIAATSNDTLKFVFSDTSKVSISNLSLKSLNDYRRINYGDSIYAWYLKDISTVGTYNEKIYAYYNGKVDSTDVSYTVIPESNVLSAPYNLVATSTSQGITVTWSDSNVTDTNIVIDGNNMDIANWVESGAEEDYTYGYNFSDGFIIERLHETATYHSYTRMFDLSISNWHEFSITIGGGTAILYTFKTRGYIDDVLQSPTPDSLLVSTTNNDTSIVIELLDSDYDSVQVVIEIKTNANGQWGYFDEFTYRNTSESYDSWILEALTYREGSATGGWNVLTTGTSGTSYFHDSDDMDFQGSDSAEYDYRVRFLDGVTYTAYSNTDNASWVIDIPISATEANYFVGEEDGTGTFFNNSEANYIPMSHFYAHFDNLDSLQADSVVAFIAGSVFQWRFTLGADNLIAWDFTGLPNGVSFIKTNGVNPVFTSLDTLYGAQNPSNWVLPTGGIDPNTSTGIYPWQYRFDDHYADPSANLTSMENIGMGRILIDSTEYPFAINAEWDTPLTPVIPSYDSAYHTTSVDYPWTLRSFSHTGNKSIYIYTGSATTSPADTFDNIMTYGAVTTLVKFYGTDNLTVRGLTFKGSDYQTVLVQNCDNFYFVNDTITNFGYRAMVINDCDIGVIDTFGIDSKYSEIGGNGRIYYEYFAAMGGIEFTNGASNIEVMNYTFMDITTMSFCMYTQSNPPTDISIHDGYIGTSYEGFMPYFRPFQIANDASSNTLSYFPTRIKIYNNIFEHTTVPIKITAAISSYYGNVFANSSWNANAEVLDHGALKTELSNQPLITIEGTNLLNNLTSNFELSFVNNTFYNCSTSLFTYVGQKFKSGNRVNFWNNLLVNISTLPMSSWGRLDGLTSSSKRIEFTIGADGRDAWDIRNNYSYNDNRSSTEDAVLYGDYDAATEIWSPENYLSWSDFDAEVSSNFSAYPDDYSTGNTQSSLSSVSEVMDVNTNYELVLSLRGLGNVGLAGHTSTSILNMFGSNFTDRWGNQVTLNGSLVGGTINFGANHKR